MSLPSNLYLKVVSWDSDTQNYAFQLVTVDETPTFELSTTNKNGDVTISKIDMSEIINAKKNVVKSLDYSSNDSNIITIDNDADLYTVYLTKDSELELPSVEVGIYREFKLLIFNTNNYELVLPNTIVNITAHTNTNINSTDVLHFVGIGGEYSTDWYLIV